MDGLSNITGTFAPALFRGKRVLVTGAISGIGLDVARGFAALGAEVLAAGSSERKIARLRAEQEGGLTFERLDVRDAAAIAGLIDRQASLDVLVNAAGVARPADEFDLSVFADVVDVNMNAAMRTATAARAKLAASGGCIVNVASMLSYFGDPAVPAYSASKTGLLGLTRVLAHAFGPEGIRVNAIAPGYHKTDMTEALWSVPHNHDAIARHAALKRWGSTADLVGASLFLASPAASFITGVCLPVDGGYSVGAVTG
jgi:NAD(P)-dependent dehydrogenase (short-subunit alcohol dehydrogenase family)